MTLFIAFVWPVILAGAGAGGATPFSHAAHLSVAPSLGCTDCHPGDATASEQRPGKESHASCDSSKCHAHEFYGVAPSAGSSLCLLCHVRAEPWAPMTDLRPFPSRHRAAREYCLNFSHRRHQKLAGGIDDCLACHESRSEDSRGFDTSRGHGSCARCHGGTERPPSGKTHSMGECEKCHPQGGATTTGERSCRPWLTPGPMRLRKAFSHARHQMDPRTRPATPLSCGQCHRSVDRAESVGSIPLLAGGATMRSSCKPCHNGRIAFDAIDECGRCHEPGVVQFDVGAPVPASHNER